MKSAVLLLPVLIAIAAVPVHAQDTVIQAENVRYAYAQVLQVSPVYQTLTATRVELRCEPAPPPPPEPQAEDSRLSRVVGAVKGALRMEEAQRPAPIREEACRSIPVEREFRRPIAYDVDYVYKGAKYRSRLPDDPGNRLRIRIGVTPVVSDARAR